VPKAPQNSALGEAFYWMAEKEAWGYEDVKINIDEAFKLYKQAADLGFSDALIRVGEFQESGKGTAKSPDAAIRSYLKAVKAGNFFGLAFLAKLLSRSKYLEKSDDIWERFFAALTANPDPGFLVASRGEVLHYYVSCQLRSGFDPKHLDVLLEYRLEIVGHHQRLLEYAAVGMLDRLEGVSKWIEFNLGPWPISKDSG
jgi:TPR repeat protein